MNEKKLQKKIIIAGKIVAKTGLHIGGTNTQMGIGGPDNLVIRNPLTQKPIIPGSSLKGKMRALLELTKGAYNKDLKKIGDVGNDKKITALFGTSADKNDKETHASRLIVRDAELVYDDKNEEDKRKWADTDMPFAEVKAEVGINRITSKPLHGVRFIERVPAGAAFSFEMVVNIVCEDNDTEKTQDELLKLLSEGMELLEDDYLGGNGSRGYGKIKFNVEKVNEKVFSENGISEKPLQNHPFEKFQKKNEKNV